MIKDEHKVIILSIIIGLIAGFIDTLVGYFIFKEAPFWDLLLLDVPVYEFYVRTFLLLIFVVFGYVISRFISKSKRIEVALKEAVISAEDEKAKSEAIIAGIGDGISIQNTDFKILYQNKIHKEFIGDRVDEFCYKAYECRENVCEGCPLAESFKDGMIHTAERSARIGKGTSYFEITASPLRDSAGKIIAGIEVVRDVTERKKLEEQLMHAQKMEAVGRLSGGIAHEFNNIMTAIMGCSEFLKGEVDEDSPLRACADGIRDSAERAAELTRGLLAYSRKQITHKKPLFLNEIILHVENILSKVVREDITLTISLTDEDPVVMVDSNQIEQVLMNLAMNAQDAMPDGGTLIIGTELLTMDGEFIRTHGFGKRGMYALISVEDTGEGMDKITKEKLFEPFFTTKDIGKGTGLGLSMVYGIIQKHSGYIDILSEPGKGTLFNVYLPLMKIPIERAQPKAEHVPSFYGSGMILIAEDDKTVRRQIRKSLEKWGYRIIESVNGDDAIAKFMANRGRIDLVLLDMIMPKKSGKEAYEEIIKVRPDIKVLFMSGYTDDVLNEKMIVEKGLSFIPKPFSPRELLRKLRDIMDNGRGKRYENAT